MSPPCDTDQCWLFSCRSLKAGGKQETSSSVQTSGTKVPRVQHDWEERTPLRFTERPPGCLRKRVEGRRRPSLTGEELWGQTNDLKPLPPWKKNYSSLQKLIHTLARAFLPCLPAPQGLESSQSTDGHRRQRWPQSL